MGTGGFSNPFQRPDSSAARWTKGDGIAASSWLNHEDNNDAVRLPHVLERQAALQFDGSGGLTTQCAIVGRSRTRDRANSRGANVCVGVPKVRMIQHVEGFDSEPKIQSLMDLESLEETEVEVLNPR